MIWNISSYLQSHDISNHLVNIRLMKKKLTFDFCWFCVVIRFFSSTPQRPITSDFEWFLYQILSITLFSYLNSRERASISIFQCWVLNKGTTGTIFITSLVWRGPWLGIEPGTSRTRSQHSVTRLSSRQLGNQVNAEECRPLLYTCTTNGMIL